MSLLTTHIQAHPGLLVAVVELLSVAKRPIGDQEIERLLQPQTLEGILGKSPPSGALGKAVDAAEWLKLVKRTDQVLVLSDVLVELDPREFPQRLPAIMAQGLFEREWGEGIEDNRGSGGDLALALSWFLAQNLWSFRLAGSDLERLYDDQVEGQVAEDQRLINRTKLRVMIRWASYLGYGRPDPVNGSLHVPDPTPAVRATLRELPKPEYSASQFVTELAKLCPVLDKGRIRKIIVDSLRDQMLNWETQKNQVSPSLSLALYRLRDSGQIETANPDDARPAQQRVLNLGSTTETIAHVRILGQ